MINTPLIKQLQHWFTLRRLFWTLTLIAGLNFLLFLSAAHFERGYSSDDVSIQLMAQSILVNDQNSNVTGANNYIIKIPLYLFLHKLMLNTETQLFITVLACNLVLFAGLIFFLAYYLKINGLYNRKNLLIAFLPVISLLGLIASNISGADVPGLYINPNLRNAEIGIMLMMIAFVNEVIRQPLSKVNLKTVSIGIAAVIFLSIFFYNDPYFLYTMGGGIILAVGMLWAAHRISITRTLLIIVPIFLAIILHRKVHIIHFGFLPIYYIPVGFTTLQNITINLESVLYAIFSSYQANFWGQHLNRIIVLVLLLNSVQVLLFFASIGYGISRCIRQKLPLQTILISITLLIMLMYGITTFSLDGKGNFRYLFVALFTSLPIVAEMLIVFYHKVKWQRTIYLILATLCITIIVNLSYNLRSIGKKVAGHLPSHTQIIYTITDELKQRGYTKGYGEFWNANLITFFSNREILTLPIYCVVPEDRFHQHHWLINLADLEKPSDKSFLVYRKDSPTFDPNHCKINSFGSPTDIIHINNNYDLYTFDYDIGNGLPQYRPGR